MRLIFARGISLLLVFVFLLSPVWATCGGGGGGGGGGTSGSGGNGGGSTKNPVVYHVPWKSPKAVKSPVTEGLILYWFTASKDELQKSTLKESRALSLYAGQCISMHLGDTTTPNSDTLVGESKLPVVVLATPEGKSVSRVENTNGKFKVADVEKMVAAEIKSRETVIDTNLKDAKAKATAGETAQAIKLYKTVAAEKCMFSRKAKAASTELKKLGDTTIADFVEASPVFEPTTSAQIAKVMKRGLIAENKEKYLDAEKLYLQASQMDPADPTPLRYLGELYRHHIGDWDKATVEFNKILNMPTDPLSRAVALHGLGKITIHNGEFKKGVGLMEQSVEIYPLALAYRNIAVYWNSEGELEKASGYTAKAFELDPNDPYNHVFSAVYLAAAGKKEEALKIAMANMDLLPASYNLAAIFAQTGNRDKALELLKRHFYQYERFHAVREKEMMEARVDAVFASIVHDKDFLELTKFADGKLPMVMSPRQAAPQAAPMKMDH